MDSVVRMRRGLAALAVVATLGAGLIAAAAPAAAQTAGVVSFQSSYRAYNAWDSWMWWLPDSCTQTQRLYGSEPAADGRYPVVLYLHGTLADWGGNVEGRRVAELAAAEGFVAVAITYDSWIVNSAATIDGNARCAFAPASGASPLAQACARPKADCSKGVAVSGFSAGGAIAGRARNYAPQVRAAWLMGVNGPGTAPALAAPAGTRALPDDALRVGVGQSELVGGDLSALDQMTGQTCTASSCLRADGSGFYVVPDAEVGDGVADHCWWQSVNRWVPSNSCTWTPTFDPGFTPPSTVPWSLRANLAWLRSRLQ